MHRFFPGRCALVLDSPHSGRQYPEDFGYSLPLERLRRAEDTHVEKLYSFAPELGASWLEALFPRSYLDLNRCAREIDPLLLASAWTDTPLTASAKVALGKGLLWRLSDEGEPIYSRRLSVEEVRSRIERCYTPYYSDLGSAIEKTHQAHGVVLHLNCHSMPAVAASHATEFPGVTHPDFVIGNRDNASSSPALVAFIRTFLERCGFSVAVNHPYKGVELVRRFSAPAAGRHSVQLEINRRLYMDEESLELHAGFAPLQAQLHELVERLILLDRRALDTK